MNNDVKTTRVNLDGIHSLDVSVSEKAKTVVAELIDGDGATFIYAEKFDVPCNYLRTAIKKSIVYLGGAPETNYVSQKKTEKSGICLNEKIGVTEVIR